MRLSRRRSTGRRKGGRCSPAAGSARGRRSRRSRSPWRSPAAPPGGAARSPPGEKGSPSSSDTEHPLGTDQEHERHHREDHRRGSFGPVGRHYRLGNADQQAGGDGAEQIAEAAERDHDERDTQHVDAHLRAEPPDRRRERAGDAGEEGAERERDGEQAMDVDAEQRNHLLVLDAGAHDGTVLGLDRKSTRLNSSHLGISYAVFCLKKKKRKTKQQTSS